MIAVEFPKVLFISANDRFPHWAEKARRTKALRTLAHLAARETAPVPTPTLVAVTIHRPRRGTLRDPDNAQPTWKALIDGFTDAGLWPDDDRHHVLGPVARIAPKNRDDDQYRFEFTFTHQEVSW